MTPVPPEILAAVHERALGACEARTPGCPPGAHLGNQAHHALMRSQGGEHVEENLIWVCSPGHRYIHDHPAESYETGWLIRGVT